MEILAHVESPNINFWLHVKACWSYAATASQKDTFCQSLLNTNYKFDTVLDHGITRFLTIFLSLYHIWSHLPLDVFDYYQLCTSPLRFKAVKAQAGTGHSMWTGFCFDPKHYWCFASEHFLRISLPFYLLSIWQIYSTYHLDDNYFDSSFIW